jgi:N,N'-diacetyllegionaminate synthase
MTFVIAEAGVNHNGRLDLALRMVEAAAAAGADAVKFQTFRADAEVSRHAPKAAYQVTNTDPGESQLEMLRGLELDRAAHVALARRCEECSIEFMSSAFDMGSVELLCELGVRRFKIPSGEITFVPYLRRIARYGHPVILSTGMATLDEIQQAIDVLEKEGLRREQITVLQCTTQYPAPYEDVNLRAMLALRERFGVAVGYSDHTLGIEVAIAAAALGASVIEKHFTTDRSLPGPDHQASLVPEELASLVRSIRNVGRALGDGIKTVTASESANRAIVRKSLVAAVAIRRGEQFSEHNVTAKRPGTGLSPLLWDEILGKKASRDFAADELLEL